MAEAALERIGQVPSPSSRPGTPASPSAANFICGQPRLMVQASMKHAIIKDNAGFASRQAFADLNVLR
jgi:hypothetical protein